MTISSYAVSRKSDADALRGKQGGLKVASGGKKFDNFRINPYLIQVDPDFNIRVRETPEEDEALARDIAKHGVRKALTVKFSVSGNVIKLRDGHRRLRATIRAIEEFGAEIETVPVVTEPLGISDQDAVAEIFRHNSGMGLHDLDMIEGIKRLLGFGWSEDKIADKTGVNVAKQKRLLALGEQPEAVKALVAEGVATASFVAAEMAKAPSQAEGVKAIQDAVKVAKAKGAKRATAKHTAEGTVSLKKVGKTLFQTLKAEGQVDTSGKEVVITVTHAQWDQIAKLFAL